MYRHQKDTIDALNELLRATALPPVAKLLVIFGYPRSDIGKGTLASHLLTLLDNSNVVKFDGLLNTNIDGRFTARDHDDFGLYTTQNPGLHITRQNHLMGGDLLREFTSEYGETNERLMLIPHLEHFFRLKLQQSWKSLDEPKTLIVEIGGTPDDLEASYVIPAIRELKSQLGTQCQIMLLTELGHNGVFVKSKVAQRGINELASRGVVPDIIVAREPRMEAISTHERINFELQLQERIAERTGVTFNNIVSVPYFADPKSGTYQSFIKKNILPMITESVKYPQVLLGTTDKPEIEEWEQLLGERFNLTTAQALGLDIGAESDDPSALRTSYARARSFCRLSGLPTITAEAALYVKGLGGKPGAGVRTWGGKLSKPMSNEEIFNYLRKEVEPLEDTSAYIEGSITVILPNGEEHRASTRDYGTISKENFAQGFIPGQYPIGQVFVHDKYGATWAEMMPVQRKLARQDRLDKIISLLSDCVESKKQS